MQLVDLLCQSLTGQKNDITRNGWTTEMMTNYQYMVQLEHRQENSERSIVKGKLKSFLLLLIIINKKIMWQ